MNGPHIPDWLLRVSGISPGDSTVRDVWFGFDGLDPGWALLICALLAALAVWLYLRGPGDIGRVARLGLAALRTLLLAGILLLLARPVLQLTHEEPARGALLMLVDASASQDIADQRIGPDLARAAIATGALPPGPVDRPVPDSAAAGLDKKTRRDLVEAAFANPALALGPKLLAETDVLLTSFAGEAGPVKPVPSDDGPDALAKAIRALPRGGSSTAIADSLGQALDATAGQPLTGILLVTDGASNTGAPLENAADLAVRRGLPVFVVASGITAPRDLSVIGFGGPPVAFLHEDAPLKVRLRATGLAGQGTDIVLRLGDTELQKKHVDFSADGESEVAFTYQPDKVGDLTLKVDASPIAGESTLENNHATCVLHVIDRHITVLYIEQQPRWEFRYLLDTLQNDKRFDVHAIMLEGDPNLGQEPGTPFLAQLPDAADLLNNVIVILGDVDPKLLGDDRMKALAQLVRATGGGLIFSAGPHFSPGAYKGTPLEPLLPVALDGSPPAATYDDPVQLALTPDGQGSPLLKLADAPAASQAVWQKFPGFRWTAKTGAAKPSATVLLVDPTPAKATQGQPQPVLATMPVGRGQVAYFGTGETWRWRSRVGEKYYLSIWGQLLMQLGVERLSGASDKVQLSTPRPDYAPGDHVRVSGRIFDDNFQPLAAASVKATLGIQPADNSMPSQQSDLTLTAIPGRPGEYETTLTAGVTGRYTVVTERDPKAAVVFTVSPLDIELRDSDLDLAALNQLAKATGGQVFREENLVDLPKAVSARLPVTTVVRRIDSAFNYWLLGALFLVACLEWLFRRLLRLK